jgi:hypothetical protein
MRRPNPYHKILHGAGINRNVSMLKLEGKYLQKWGFEVGDEIIVTHCLSKDPPVNSIIITKINQ